MNKLLSVAVVAAIALPSIIVAAPVQAASGPQYKAQHSAAKPGINRVNKLIQRCNYKRISISAERLALKMSGYTRIKYLGTNVFAPRCAQFVRFSACKGASKYKVTVRYIKGVNRYVIAQRTGLCLVIAPKLKLKTR